MRKNLLWGIAGAIVLSLIAAIIFIAMDGSVGGLTQESATASVGQRAGGTTLPVTETTPAGDVRSRESRRRSVAMAHDDGPGYPSVVLISLFIAVVCAFAGSRYSRRQFASQLAQIGSDIENLKRARTEDRAKAEAAQRGPTGGFGSDDPFQAHHTDMNQTAIRKAYIPPATPTPQIYATQPEQAPAPDPWQPPHIDEAELLRQQKEQEQADLAAACRQSVVDFHDSLSQFLEGSGVSQKAFDTFISQHGRSHPVQNIDGDQIHLAGDPTGQETLLALQLRASDAIILLPSFYFIGDFAGLFARNRDIPRDIRAAFDVVSDGSGQLRIVRLGSVNHVGESLVLATPRGELSGFIA